MVRRPKIINAAKPTMDIFLHDMQDIDVRLLDQLIARAMVAETGVCPYPQFIGTRRNETIKAWVHATAEKERQATIAMFIPGDLTNEQMLEIGKHEILLAQGDGAGRLRLVFDRRKQDDVVRTLRSMRITFAQDH
jgi:hypothetical protein